MTIERYEDLCRTVSIFLRGDDALDVLALMEAGAEAQAPRPAPLAPVEAAVRRLGTILDLDLDRVEAPASRPYDWAAA